MRNELGPCVLQSSQNKDPTGFSHGVTAGFPSSVASALLSPVLARVGSQAAVDGRVVLAPMPRGDWSQDLGGTVA